MKKFLAVLLIFAMVFTFAACGGGDTNEGGGDEQAADTTYKVGMVCIGDDNAAYDRNFYMAADAAKERLAGEGINVEWVYTYNHPEGDPVATDCEELAGAGCIAVFCNSYGMEPAMLTVAPDYPDTVFVGMTNEASWKDDLPNTVNAFPSIYEGRYLAGVAAGMKLQDMIDNGEIKEDEAVIGYVGAYTFAEVISGYTSFFLGARSVCPSVTMKVEFIGSWGDPTMEANAAQDLIDKGAKLISQHSDSTTPATTAQSNGVPHVGYNISMSDVAPEASIISSRIDWTNYFTYVIETIVNGGTVDQDYCQHGFKDGDVALTELNEDVAAPGTGAKIAEVGAAIENGEIQVFDTSTFTVDGKEVTTAFALDTDGDFAPDSEEAVFDGAFHESYFQSAPYFALRIDGIELLNEKY
ncbi:MAG: BMP family ABC transporter substrate-binding protein [Clostridiales bacterium]|nr:BMP family ABC transporter substrate-binding protein [Clostridiales bacterium]